MKKYLALLLALVMALSLGACSKPAETTPPVDSDPVDAEPAMEDSLVIYSTMTDAQLENYLATFATFYPDVEVEVVSGGLGDLIARVTAEKENPGGDVVLGGLSDTDGDAYADIFEQYTSPNVDEILESCRSNNGYSNFNATSTVCLCINKDLEAELGMEIKSYADLLDPKLKGKIIMADPNSSSSAWNNVCNFMSVYGYDTDEAWDFISKLMPNLVITNSSSNTFNSVVSGEYTVGISYENGVATVLESGAENIEIVYPSEGVSGMASGMAVIKNCKNPVAAKAFVDVMMSADGQTTLYTYNGSTRQSNTLAVPSDNSVLPASSEIVWATRPVNELKDGKEAILEHWNNLAVDLIK